MQLYSDIDAPLQCYRCTYLMTWGEAEHLAKDRNTWRNVVAEFAEEARRG